MNGKLNFSARYVPGLVERVGKVDQLTASFWKPRICRIEVLIVTDTPSGSYGNGSFGLSTFLKAFDEPLPFTSFQITKAHRTTDSSGLADIENFRFNTHNLDQYDVIFLFGISRSGGQALSQSELRAVSEYMDNGGGMFATGDHEDLGVDMCGQIPRVRSMRRWYYPNPGPNGEPVAPAVSGSNHNTIVSTPGGGNQSDLVPQPIYPRYYYRFLPYFTPNPIYPIKFLTYPHPVLCSPDGVIKVLPDHMHEGLCEVPSDLTQTFNFDGYNVTEYPLVGANRIKPEVIANATNHQTNPDSSFGVIAALDGHKHADIGRVLVDATWHHFFNINISQFQTLKDQVDGGYIPDATEVAALQAYNHIQHYFRNIAYWLARRSTQQCYRYRGWWWILNHVDVRMNYVIRKRSSFQELTYYHHLGTVARNALGDLESDCQFTSFFPYLELQIREIQQIEFLEVIEDSLPFIHPDIITNVTLGAAVSKLLPVFEENRGDVGVGQIEEVIYSVMKDSIELLCENVTKSAKRLKTVLF